MDDGKGKFIELETDEQLGTLRFKNPNHGGWFRVGEEVELKGSRFRVKAVKPTELRLKLLPKKLEE